MAEAIAGRIAILSADPRAYTVDAMNGPQTQFLDIPSLQPLRDAADGEAMLSRWWAMGPWVDAQIAQLRRGLGEGRGPVAGSVRRVIAQLDELLGATARGLAAAGAAPGRARHLERRGMARLRGGAVRSRPRRAASRIRPVPDLPRR